MSAMASQITSLAIVYSTVYSGADQRKHQSSVSLAFVRGIHRSPVNSPHKGPVTRKMFPFVDVIMLGAYHPDGHRWKPLFRLSIFKSLQPVEDSAPEIMAIIHYPNQRWPSLPTYVCVTRPRWVNTHDRQFPDSPLLTPWANAKTFLWLVISLSTTFWYKFPVTLFIYIKYLS